MLYFIQEQNFWFTSFMNNFNHQKQINQEYMLPIKYKWILKKWMTFNALCLIEVILNYN